MPGSGRKVFANGNTLSASDVQNYLQDQSVMYFANTAARTSAIASPTTGMVSYVGDTPPQIESYTGASWQSLGGLTQVANVSFTATATVQVNNIFSTTYDNYVFQLRYTQNTATGNLFYQNSLSGTPSATGYNGTGYSSYATSSGTLLGGGSPISKINIGNSLSGSPGYIVANLNSPALAVITLYTSLHTITSSGAGGTTSGFVGANHSVATAYDGMTLTVDAGTITGNLRIYGLRNS